jgi:hypothetical protein
LKEDAIATRRGGSQLLPFVWSPSIGVRKPCIKQCSNKKGSFPPQLHFLFFLARSCSYNEEKEQKKDKKKKKARKKKVGGVVVVRKLSFSHHC